MNEKLLLEAKLKILEKQNAPVKVQVHGTSMLPLIKDGDLITSVRGDKFYSGEILLFKYRNSLIVHRMLLKSKGLHYLKGDNCVNLEKVEKTSIIGKVIAINDKSFKRRFKDIVIVPFSYFMYVSWRKSKNYERVMKGFCAKMISKVMKSGL